MKTLQLYDLQQLATIHLFFWQLKTAHDGYNCLILHLFFLLVDVFGISDESLVDESHKLQIVQIVLSSSVQ